MANAVAEFMLGDTGCLFETLRCAFVAENLEYLAFCVTRFETARGYLVRNDVAMARHFGDCNTESSSPDGQDVKHCSRRWLAVRLESDAVVCSPGPRRCAYV